MLLHILTPQNDLQNNRRDFRQLHSNIQINKDELGYFYTTPGDLHQVGFNR